MCFKVYGYISMKQAITFLQDFKLGHYMKIPPREMFIAQVSFTIPLFSLRRFFESLLIFFLIKLLGLIVI